MLAGLICPCKFTETQPQISVGSVSRLRSVTRTLAFSVLSLSLSSLASCSCACTLQCPAAVGDVRESRKVTRTHVISASKLWISEVWSANPCKPPAYYFRSCCCWCMLKTTDAGLHYKYRRRDGVLGSVFLPTSLQVRRRKTVRIALPGGVHTSSTCRWSRD